jgi:hypothetical protein
MDNLSGKCNFPKLTPEKKEDSDQYISTEEIELSKRYLPQNTSPKGFRREF